MQKKPVMLYLTDDEVEKLFNLVAASPAALWDDDDDDGPYDQLKTFRNRNEAAEHQAAQVTS